MNAVEIEQAVSQLAEQPFDAAEFPFEFLRAFGNKETVIRRLRSGNNNASDVPGGVLQRNNIHLATCAEGAVVETLRALRDSPRTAANKARFVLATDGALFHAEDLTSDDPPVICEYAKFPDRFGFFLPLAGITTVKQIRESAFDIRATGRLNRLYRQLLSDNPDWDRAERRPDMNHFMARLIFCFFAEDTGIFNGEGLFTRTVIDMSERDASNTHAVIEAIFRAMNTTVSHDGNPDDRHRKAAGTPRWADAFPYVNGGLFSGDLSVPRFSRIARSYFLTIGGLDWTKINPDIFGSMIQAVADDEERGELGMHYTSVPNILKVLNPLFLDALREQLEAAGDNARSLLNLRKRMSRIRVFDPACGSGNFLVIAYKEMRAIEAVVNRRRGEGDRRSEIPLTNFRGIELRDFAAEIARLALIIAEYQCDVLYRGQKEALAEFLPLNAQNWIVCANALQIEWPSLCPPQGASVRLYADDLFNTPLEQPEIDFENEGGETYLCGNPPYQGYSDRTKEQSEDVDAVLGIWGNVRRLDYICCWFKKASDYLTVCDAKFAFVSTNSICQGEQVSLLWPNIFRSGLEIFFAHTSFDWRNSAQGNAGVTCVIVGVARTSNDPKIIFDGEIAKAAKNISPYLIDGPTIVMSQRERSISRLPEMSVGSTSIDGGHLVFDGQERKAAVDQHPDVAKYIKPFIGSAEIVKGQHRYCLWISDVEKAEAETIPWIKDRIEACRQFRSTAGRDAQKGVAVPHRFFYRKYRNECSIVVPMTSSGRREYVTAVLAEPGVVVSHGAFVVYGGDLAVMSILLSKLHAVWMATTSARMRNDYRYSVNLTYCTFPIPNLMDSERQSLASAAAEILIAREKYYPETIADLYDPDKMPDDLRHAHERNDETLERIYIGRRFRNDTERLEKLFDLYTKMSAAEAKTKGAARAR